MSIKNILKIGPERPKSIVILGHGYGASGADLIGLAEMWAPFMPDTLFLSPDAPHPCEINPTGFQWFSLGDWDPLTLSKNIIDSSDNYNEFINQILSDFSLDSAKLALVGFSQGTMLSLHAALRRPQAVAGVLGYSGAVVGAVPDTTPLFPIALCHGDRDDVVPIQSMQIAQQLIGKKGFSIDTHVMQGVGHGIDQGGLAWGLSFLRKILG